MGIQLEYGRGDSHPPFDSGMIGLRIGIGCCAGYAILIAIGEAASHVNWDWGFVGGLGIICGGLMMTPLALYGLLCGCLGWGTENASPMRAIAGIVLNVIALMPAMIAFCSLVFR